MNRLIPCFIALISTLGILSAAHAQVVSERPNVIVILADDLGYSDLGCYGSEIETPNLDRLASGGVRLSSFYTSARCCPSRASLLTGLHPHQAGVGSFATREPREGWGNAYVGHLLPSCMTMAELLRNNGYSTWMVGKWHLGNPGPIERGFENYFGYRDFLAYATDQWEPEGYVRLPSDSKPEIDWHQDEFYATDVFSAYAVEFVRKASAGEKPFFLYLAHSSPHFPVQAPKASIDQHVETYRKGWDKLRADRFAKQKELGLFPENLELPPRSLVPVDRDDIANGYSGKPNPAWNDLDEDRQADLARRGATFAAMVDHVDQGVGELLAELESLNELDNTLIVFLSDNGACYEWGPFGFDGPSRQGLTTLHRGETLATMGQKGTHHSYGSGWANLGNTPLNMYKHFCHEGGIASPCIVHWPAQLSGKGEWIREPAHLMDIVPTVLEATKTKYPEAREETKVTPLEGRSLLPAINGTEQPTRSLAFEHQGARGLRQGDWKVVWGKRQPTTIAWQLYNLVDDPSEQTDVADAHPEILNRLVGEWERWAKRVGAEPFQRDDSQTTHPAEPVATPEIAGLPFAISARIVADRPHGVVVAQGGVEQGYSLHFIEGKAVFDVRVNGKVTRLMSQTPLAGEIELTARLDKDVMLLEVNDQPALECKSPGLIPVQPKDGLNVGFDGLSAAGTYSAPHRFSGKVLSLDVKVKAAED